MKRLAVIFLTGALILSLGMPQALATQDEVTEAGTEIISSDFPEEELDKVLTQDSPWYFLKRFFERVRIIFTFRQDAKAKVWADLAEERAREYAALEKKYAGEDIDEEQLKLLDKALQEVLKFTEEYMEHILEDEEGEEVPEEGEGEAGDKYLRRIAHLQRIAERAPESAQRGLSRAIANARRQRARMIAKGKLYDPDLETEYYSFQEFTLKIKQADCLLEADYKQNKDEIDAQVKIKQGDVMDVRLKGCKALEYLLPVFDEMNLEASMPQEEVISAVLAAFGRDEGYDELKLKIKFNDGTKINIEIDPDDDESNPAPPANLSFLKFEFEIEAKDKKLEAEYQQEKDKAKAKVKVELKDGQDSELTGNEALAYLLPILEGLKLDASMAKEDILGALLTAFGWSGSWQEAELKVKFSDGSELELEWKQEEDAKPVTGVPFKAFKLEVESHDREMEAELKQKDGKYEAKVEIEQEKGRDIELKGSKALDYLLPIFNRLKLNKSMSDRNIIDNVLKAFNWEGPWKEIEIKIWFADGTKLVIEKELDD